GSVSGRSVLMLRYCNDASVVGFCMPAAPGLGVDRILACRTLVSLETASRIWGPFAERLGLTQEGKLPSPLWREEEVGWGEGTISVRRPRHRNFLVDRLMQRERDLASSTLSRHEEDHAEASALTKLGGRTPTFSQQ